MTKEPISIQKVKADLRQIVHKKISRAWKGYGSALFLELGDLHKELAWKKTGEPTTSLTGEWTLSSEGAWKLLRDGKEVLHAEKASSSQIKDVINMVEGLTITVIAMSEKMRICLSNNDILEFNKAEYGFFTLVCNEKTFISYEDDAPYVHYASL